MKRTVLFLLGGLILLQVHGCAAMQPSDQSVAWRLQSLEEGFLETQENQRRVMAKLDQNQQSVEERLAALEAALQRLGAELPASAVQTVASSASSSAVSSTASSGVEQPMISAGQATSELTPVTSSGGGMSEPRVDVPAVVAGPESSEDKPWAEVPGESSAKASVQSPTPKATARPQPVFQSQSGPKQLYHKALDLTLNDHSAEARPLFQEFLTKYPGNELAPNAMYWLGETYYAEKDYPQAILTFKDVTTKYPDHPKAAASLLKIGMSYRNVGDVDNAMFYLRTLVDEHPNTEPARLARRVLQELAG